MKQELKRSINVFRAAIFLFAFAAVNLACSSAEPAPFIPSADRGEEIPAAASLEVRYIANEGVLISSRDKRVLIDGLHRKYKDDYAFLPDAEREKIESGAVRHSIRSISFSFRIITATIFTPNRSAFI